MPKWLFYNNVKSNWQMELYIFQNRQFCGELRFFETPCILIYAKTCISSVEFPRAFLSRLTGKLLSTPHALANCINTINKAVSAFKTLVISNIVIRVLYYTKRLSTLNEKACYTEDGFLSI